MASDPNVLAPEDHRLLERLADRIVELRLEVPAILTLESAKPLSFVASQAMVFFQPFVSVLHPVANYERFARLMEHREAVERFTRIIEERADAARRARRTGTPSPRP